MFSKRFWNQFEMSLYNLFKLEFKLLADIGIVINLLIKTFPFIAVIFNVTLLIFSSFIKNVCEKFPIPFLTVFD